MMLPDLLVPFTALTNTSSVILKATEQAIQEPVDYSTQTHFSYRRVPSFSGKTYDDAHPGISMTARGRSIRVERHVLLTLHLGRRGPFNGAPRARAAQPVSQKRQQEQMFPTGCHLPLMLEK